MEWKILLDTITSLLGAIMIAALSIILLFIRKKISTLFLDKIWSKVSSKYQHRRINPSEIAKDVKIREALVELRTIVEADRASLFQFHNGNIFSTSNPIWKVSNTHETVSPGISSEIKDLQDIKASTIIDTLSCLFSDDKYPKGIERIRGDKCSSCVHKKSKSKTIFIDVIALEDGYSRALLMEQGIKYLLDVPIHNAAGHCIGFVTVNYCGNTDITHIKDHCHDICKYASIIEFLLLKGT